MTKYFFINRAVTFLICCPILLSCKKSSVNGTLPIVSIQDNKVERSISNANITFKVTLTKSAAADVAVQYRTVDGTALGNKDYVSSTGTLTIVSGQTFGEITIVVIGDSVRRANRQFSIQLFNAQNCKISTDTATGTIIDENGLSLAVDNSGYSTPRSYPGYTLSWSDEFDGKTINSSNWSFETGQSGWGNNELENYTDSYKNSFVSNGNLIIEARKVTSNPDNYTSARMITKGKKVFKYGRVDIRAKLPKGQGIWPALWLLGSNIDMVNWPACGEIDMMELLGQNPSKIYGTLHWGSDYTVAKSLGTNYVLNGKSFDEQFHVYSLDWQKGIIKLLIDDNVFFSATASDITGSNPFDNSFYFLFNVAVGGNWPGNPDSNTAFPQRMVVDYIRVFQQ